MRKFLNKSCTESLLGARASSAVQGVVLLATLLFFSRPILAQVAIDTTISIDQNSAKTTVATAAFSTKSTNELLLAFVSTDYKSGANTTVTGISGAGLTWALVQRTNVEKGSSEIWRAFAPATLSNVTVTATLSQKVVSSMTVMTFSGVDTSGTNGSGAVGATASGSGKSGAPSAMLTTMRNGSLVLGVGNDFDNAINRTPGTGQTVIHQYLSSSGDTYWVQRQNAATPATSTTWPSAKCCRRNPLLPHTPSRARSVRPRPSRAPRCR